MIKIAINNQQDILEVNENLKEILQNIADKTAELEGYNQGEISFALVDNSKIQELNRKYRQLDSPTDVLSFSMDDEIWGDIIISTERAASQAEEYGHSLEREFGYLAIHGILHLLGYNHKTPGEKAEMRQKEERVLSELKLSRD
ncbi:MAG: rRNA maturation RNase YbeY [Halanaerobiales bacterium]